VSDLYWTWSQRIAEAVTLLGLGLHGYRQFRKGLAELAALVGMLQALPDVKERLKVAEDRLAHHLSDGHGPPPAPVPPMRPPSASQGMG